MFYDVFMISLFQTVAGFVIFNQQLGCYEDDVLHFRFAVIFPRSCESETMTTTQWPFLF